MPNYPQSLLFTAGLQQVWLREISGIEEQSVAGTDVAQAIGLVERLLVTGHGQVSSASAIASPDRDRILAAVYQQTYGDRIMGTLTCSACEKPFDMDFSLGGFVGHAHGAATSDGSPSLRAGKVVGDGGLILRIPTGEDELSVLGQGEGEAVQSLLQRLWVEGEMPGSTETAEALLTEAAPMLQTEMAAHCPECGQEMAVLFDVQSYLLQSLLRDQERLVYEVHRLAACYGWTFKDILELPRSMRRSFAQRIESEMVATNA